MGIVISAGAPDLERQWKGKKVVLVPGRGWASDPEGPETGNYATLGGTKFFPNGKLSVPLTKEVGAFYNLQSVDLNGAEKRNTSGIHCISCSGH